ncbi:ABC transporter permease [Nordella sp. HKS 07]|uniref:ABC transporter permease n=1 Tax=Nordella sp. HKS 07 TaxID=2712222 RepID=UPI0013E1CC97|nr:ABC transporter permease [Nordella sp. HKS 07]QIG50449.1 ABC transporter permease [Nordella sp. HKS 07]
MGKLELAGKRRLTAQKESAGILVSAGWWGLSIGLFAAIWELAWATGLANPLVLPPPHVFLSGISYQAKFFDPSMRMGNPTGLQVASSFVLTVTYTLLRVIAGLAVAFAMSMLVGVLIRYFRIFGRLTFPIINTLAPISPIAWLPIAIFAFGVGNVAAVFLVVITLFFIMTIATVNQIDRVGQTPINVARTMGASRFQIFTNVIVPSILPSLFTVLRLNVFAAWMIVLIAELIGIGNGLGQVIMISRNTFNAELTILAMAVVGVVGYALDAVLRVVQRKCLYWNSTNV